MSTEPVFFDSPAAWREWLAEHHADAAEVVVGYHKKATGRPSMTWAESVAEALCFGWIDGVRRSLGPDAYTAPHRLGRDAHRPAGGPQDEVGRVAPA